MTDLVAPYQTPVRSFQLNSWPWGKLTQASPTKIKPWTLSARAPLSAWLPQDLWPGPLPFLTQQALLPWASVRKALLVFYKKHYLMGVGAELAFSWNIGATMPIPTPCPWRGGKQSLKTSLPLNSY